MGNPVAKTENSEGARAKEKVDELRFKFLRWATREDLIEKVMEVKSVYSTHYIADHMLM